MAEKLQEVVLDTGQVVLEVEELEPEAEAEKQSELDKEFESVHGVDLQKYQKARDIWLADPTESEYKNNHDIPEPWWDNYFEVDLALPGGHKKYGIKSADDGDFCTQEELDEWAKAQDQSWYITDEKNFHTLETWMARNAISDDEEEE
jgi:hypothetical protein